MPAKRPSTPVPFGQSDSLAELLGLGSALILALPLRNWLGIGTPLSSEFSPPLLWYFHIILAWLSSRKLFKRNIFTLTTTFALAAGTSGLVAWLTSSWFFGIRPRSLFLVLVFCMFAFPLLSRRIGRWLHLTGWTTRIRSVLADWGRTADQRHIDLYFFTVGMIAFLFTFVSLGMGFSPDSAAYVLGGSFKYPGAPMLDPSWPPLFPIMIGLLTWVTPFPAQAGQWLVALSGVTVVFTFMNLLRLISRQFWLNMLFGALLVTLDGWFLVGRMVWSELTFTALVLAAIFFAVRAYQARQIQSWIYPFVFASLASLTRYIGIVLPLALFTAIWLHNPRYISRKRLTLVGLSLIPLCGYLLRNRLVFGTFAGPRLPSTTSFPTNVTNLLTVVGEDIPWPVLLSLGLMLLVMVRYKDKFNEQMGFLMRVVTSILFFYLVFLLYFSTEYWMDPISTRFLFPLYPLLLILLLVFLLSTGKLLDLRAGIDLRLFSRILIFSLLLLALYQQVEHFQRRSLSIALQKNQPLSHYQAGYATSSTADLLSRALYEAIAEEDVRLVYLQFSQEEIAPVFFLQESQFNTFQTKPIWYQFSTADMRILLSTPGAFSFRSIVLSDASDPTELLNAVKHPAVSAPFLVVYSFDSKAFQDIEQVRLALENSFYSETVQALPYVLTTFVPKVSLPND